MKSQMTLPSMGVIFTLLSFAIPTFILAQTEESRWADQPDSKAKSFTLTRRTDNGAYGTSAFSFRKDSQDIAEHKNYVDLVFNGCGSLHFNPCGGMDSRVADLGKEDLSVEVKDDKQRVWATRAFAPQEGHVYLHKVKCNTQTMTVKFRIEELNRDQIKIRWAIIDQLQGIERGERGEGLAGTMGQCGGPHPNQ